MTVALVVAGVVAAIPAALRWLRVAQREHYLPGVGRFVVRWYRSSSLDLAAAVLAVAAFVVGLRWTEVWWVIPVVAAATPLRLGVGGRTSPIAWTARMRRLTAIVAITLVTATALAVVFGTALPVMAWLLAAGWIVDGATVVAAPLERRLSSRWVDEAARTLADSGAKVVAITGSYGKTSTKFDLAHLLASVTSVVASPASFNNRLGLARAVNEHLTPGTQVFVAEMGTYGPGEIAEMVRWIPPTVGVVTAIGPVHLERMKSEDRIADNKAEILSTGAVPVLNIDHPLLADLADDHPDAITCSTVDHTARVYADAESGRVTVDGTLIGRFDPATTHGGNVACAVGAVVALGFDPAEVGERLGTLPVTAHRRSVAVSDRGVHVIDDTFNSNPSGARSAVAALARLGDGRRALVTPGMVELGPRQAVENRTWITESARTVTDLVVVGRTNRPSLLDGARAGGIASVIVVDTREEAVAWVRSELTAGDAVLYENDLPDHYP